MRFGLKGLDAFINASVLLSGIASMLILLAFSAEAADRPVVVMLGVSGQGPGISGELLRSLNNYQAKRITKAGFQLLSKEQTEKLFSQGTFSSCAEVARSKHRVEKIVVSTVRAVASGCVVEMRVHSFGRDGKEESQHIQTQCKEKHLLNGIRILSARLIGRVTRAAQPAKTATPSTAVRPAPPASIRPVRQPVGPINPRLEKAWQIVRAIASDPRESRESKIQALKIFLAEFKSESTYRNEALQLLAEHLPGVLVVKVNPPGAAIFIDGIPAGTRSIRKEMKAATHEVRAEIQGYRASVQQVRVEPGETTTLKIKLKKIPTGRVYVSTKPGKTVITVNGKEMGKAPVSVKLEEGRHRVEASLRGYRSASQTVLVFAGRKQNVSLVLEVLPPGTLIVDTRPSGATLVLDGKQVGATPFFKEVQAETYQIAIEKDAYLSHQQTVKVASGKQTEIKVTLKPIPVVLSIRSNPAGASVLLNGQAAGKTPMVKELAGGKVEVSLRLDGFMTETRSVKLDQKKRTEVNVQLRQLGVLIVESDAPAAEVWVNGVQAGKVPFSRQLEPGRYQIKVVSPNRESFSQVAVIESGLTTRVSSSLPVLLLPEQRTPAKSRQGQKQVPPGEKGAKKQESQEKEVEEGGAGAKKVEPNQWVTDTKEGPGSRKKEDSHASVKKDSLESESVFNSNLRMGGLSEARFFNNRSGDFGTGATIFGMELDAAWYPFRHVGFGGRFSYATTKIADIFVRFSDCIFAGFLQGRYRIGKFYFMPGVSMGVSLLGVDTDGSVEKIEGKCFAISIDGEVAYHVFNHFMIGLYLGGLFRTACDINQGRVTVDMTRQHAIRFGGSIGFVY